MRFLRFSVMLTSFLILISAAVTCEASCFASAFENRYNLLTPRAHQLDIEASDTWAFVSDSSTVRRRKDSSPDTAIRLGPDMGTTEMQLPEVLLSYWFDSVNAAQFQFRWFAPYGSQGGTQPLFFSGSVISPKQVLSPVGTRWFTVG